MLAALLCVAFPAAAHAADGERPSPEAAYVNAVTAMRSLDVPASVTYHSAWTSTGAGTTIVQDGKRVVVQVGIGRAFHASQTYDLSFSTGDRVITVTTATDHLSGPGSRLLDPTWAGAYDILRYGLHGEPPSGSPTLTPAVTAPGAPAEPATIASVVAISPAFYRVNEGGAGACPSGDAGRVLTLTALRDAPAHPLTEVTVDATNGRFCSMRFNVNQAGLMGVTGDYEIHFAQAGSYWLVSGGFADVSARIMGIAARRVVLRWENSNITTPTPPPTPAPAPSS